MNADELKRGWMRILARIWGHGCPEKEAPDMISGAIGLPSLTTGRRPRLTADS